MVAYLYYPYIVAIDIRCWWYIKAPQYHVIRFTFLEFLLPYDRGCHKVYLEIYDRDQESGSSLGRFCGYIYPDFVQSSSNVMTIQLHVPRLSEPTRGFRARYEFLKVHHLQEGYSMFVKDCPSSCTCTSLSTSGNKAQADKVVVEARHWLSDIPTIMPRRTAALMFREKKITRIKGKAFSRLPSLIYMDLSWNHIIDIEDDAFLNGSSLEHIRLNNNFIKSLPQAAFHTLKRLKMLDFGENLLTSLTENIFNGLKDLRVLSLRSNRIKSIPKDLFRHATNLTYLFLQDNGISSLRDGTFRFLHKLVYMNLSQNGLSSLNKNTFQGLTSLKHLDLRANKLSKVEQDAFVQLTALEELCLDAFIYCCYAEKSIPGIKCSSTQSNEFSSCDDLMKNQVLRVFIWILGIFAVFGNMLVIIRRIRNRSGERDTQSFFLFNLAIADFLMGVYLIIIAVVDIQWKGEYFKHDLSWRSGYGCAIAGILSMLSSLVSVVMLTIVTCDRLICIVAPFSTRKITRTHAAIISGCLWIFGLVSSVLPVMNLDYFKTSNDEFDFGFYGRSSVCLPAQLSPERLAGWEYAAAFFLGMPFIAFMFILIAYIAIFYRVSRSSHKIRSTAVNRESSLAKKLVFIILTDFLCWMPVIVIGTLALSRTFYDPTKQVYVWIAIFVLPINSSINPFLYTFSNLRRPTSTESKPKAFRLSLFGIKRIKNNSNGIKDCTVTETFYSGGDFSRQGSRKNVQKSPTEEPAYLIKIQEEMKIQKYHSGVGYILAEVENQGLRERCLIKYFDEDMEDAWEKELGILSLINQPDNNENRGVSLARCKWHCRANEHLVIGIASPETHEITNSALICFDYVPNKCLHDYLENKEPLTVRIVSSLCIDIISTIEFLQKCGISNNNINTRAIVVRQTDSQDTPVRAVIVDFSRATKLQKYDDGSLAKADILQFRFLFRVLLRKCREDSSHYQQIDDILSLCKYERKVDTAESIKYCLTRALMETEEALDTKL